MATETATIAVIGLGNMGSPMSRHLLAAGFPVQGYDVRPEAAQALEDAGGRAAASPGEAAGSADVVITSLPSVAALRAVVDASDGLAAAASPARSWSRRVPCPSTTRRQRGTRSRRPVR